MKVNVLRNKEIKAIIAKVVIIQLIFLAALLFLMKSDRDNVLQGVIDSKAQVIYEIIEKYPELEKEIAGLIVMEKSQEDIEKGREILSRYGYDIRMDYVLEPIVSEVERNRTVALIISITAMIILSLLVIYFEMKKVYIKVQEAYTYVDGVLKGDNLNSLDYEGEGEFPILANEINKMVSVIKKDNEIINSEKLYLKEILTDISHQLKTPLTSIKMLTDILIDKENMDKNKRIEFLNKVSIQSEKMEWLIYNLLKIARLDAGTIEFEKTIVSFDEVISVSLSLLDTKLGEKDIKLNIIGDNAKFIGDKEWTTEAITNILKNAIEHSKSQGEIIILKEESIVYSRLVIKDNGEGISKKDLPHIFKRFYTGTKSLKSESIGVGLAMTKSIIEKQNGYILVKSEVGMGTEFEITFIRNS